jgi:hypothetical protein
MIVFLIPLKSKQVSQDWKHVSTLFERCVRSIVNQTSENFRVVIVCHERPEIQITHPSIHYVEVDFPPPKLDSEYAISFGLMEKDKNQKMWLGLNYADRLNPSHVMFVDADDCVSCRIADFVSHNPDNDGWFIDSGYVYKDGSDRIFYKKKNFHLMNGTSAIIKYALVKNESMNSIDVDWSTSFHQHVVNVMEQKKNPLLPLPFPGAVYIVENGENIWADQGKSVKLESKLAFLKNLALNYPRKLRTLMNTHRLEESLVHEFSLIDFN